MIVINQSELKGEPMAKYISKIFWFLLAVLGFVCGVVGLMLPVIPQVPFFLLGIFSVSKVSPRFHHWITHTKLYQKYVLKMVNYLTRKTEQLQDAGSLSWYQRIFVKMVSVVAVKNEN